MTYQRLTQAAHPEQPRLLLEAGRRVTTRRTSDPLGMQWFIHHSVWARHFVFVAHQRRDRHADVVHAGRCVALLCQRLRKSPQRMGSLQSTRQRPAMRTDLLPHHYYVDFVQGDVHAPIESPPIPRLQKHPLVDTCEYAIKGAADLEGHLGPGPAWPEPGCRRV